MKSFLKSIGRKTAILTVSVLLIIFGVVERISYLTAPPDGDKECEQLNRDFSVLNFISTAIASTVSLPWAQEGGVINDASCINETQVEGVVAIKTEDDIRNSLAYAQAENLEVSMAGAKHSMGGQAFAQNNLILDMSGYNQIEVNEQEMTMTVQSGATWDQIQDVLHPQFAVSAMQSTNIFTVGGSISVNAHGMDHRAGAVENTIEWMRVMLPDGSVHTVSRDKNPELYETVVGGYGLAGVILDAKIKIVDNDLYTSKREVIDYQEFPAFFEDSIMSNDDIGLMYAHLSTFPGDSFLKETLVYTYEQTPDESVSDADIPPLGEVSSTKLRRFVINLAKYGGLAQRIKWMTEKHVEPLLESCRISRNQAQASGEKCLVSRNEPMNDSVKYLKNDLKNETDILHEYFIPRDNIVTFIDDMREVLRDQDVNLLNASIRAVNAERGLLSYAPKEAYSVVLYINQKTTKEGHRRMAALTSDLIDITNKHDGRFFLPYQLHYSPEQLEESYPEINTFFQRKQQYDPNELFTNTFYNKYVN
ncbi:MAG: FAD-binding oxidoreductase [Candidatus Paceibacterota bacterium]